MKPTLLTTPYNPDLSAGVGIVFLFYKIYCFYLLFRQLNVFFQKAFLIELLM